MPFTQQEVGRALERGEFVPYFQPLVDLRSGEIHGFEILARWKHPTRGLTPPAVFIPLLERYRLMNNLTAALLIPAFAAARTLPSSFGFSVNLSPPQLHDRSLPRLLEVMADEAEFDLTRLTVELTETALVDDLELAGKVAHALKDLGIHLALDDFGTGYSSLLHLQSFPFDELKVDASFVRSMTQTRQSRKITAAVISLGLSLGLKTVAEGIEEQNQANLLAWQGCTLGQGYLYGKPVPADQLEGLLTRPEPFPRVTTEVPASISSSFVSLEARPTEQLSQLRAVYDSAPVGLGFLDRQLRHVNLNQRLAQLSGKSVEAHLGRKVSEMVDPRAYQKFEPYLLRALEGESFTNIEINKPMPPGEPPRTMMSSYEPVRDETGEILGVCVAVADITTLKEKEAALRESEDHYRHTVELNPQMPWVADTEGNLISISSRWTVLTGMSTEEAVKLGWARVVHPDDLQASIAAIMNSMKTEEPFDFEHRIRSKDGWVWMRSRGYPRRNSEGRVIRWYGGLESIDECKRAVEELRCSEARLRAVFDAAPVGISLIESGTYRILSVNPRMEEITGVRITPGMIWSSKNQRLFDVNGNFVPAERSPLERAFRSGEATEAEDLFVVRPDGSSRWLRLTVAPVHLDNGTQWGAVVIAQKVDNASAASYKPLGLSNILKSLASPDTPVPLSASAWVD